MRANHLDDPLIGTGPTPRPARSNPRRHLAALAATALAATAVAAATPAMAATAGGGPTLNCTVHTLSVAIADPGPADQTMWGQLCYRGTTEPATVQLLVHGGTYTHTYWDFPYGNGYYSYVDAATLAGYATFNVDRIGAGNSSHPPSSQLDTPAGAVALHDAITDLRNGTVDGHSFSHVIWVSHSLGSFTAWYEISAYHDVDAAILTGALHNVNPNNTGFANDFYPAVDDPQFANSGLDGGYLTTVPGTRESLFYDQATADPNVVALDEATKSTLTVPEFEVTGDVFLPPSQAISQGVTVPVLLVDGQDDNLFCLNATAYNCANPASVQTFESQYYPAQANIKVVTIPNTGHDLALSTTAPVTDAAMLAWALLTVAP